MFVLHIDNVCSETEFSTFSENIYTKQDNTNNGYTNEHKHKLIDIHLGAERRQKCQ